MPYVSITPNALAGIERCYLFLYEKAPEAADRALAAVDKAFRRLEDFPNGCRPYQNDPTLRELIIRFGKGAYLALYRYEPDEDIVYVLDFRHGREAGYRHY